MVKRSIDQQLRLRNFDARHGRIESGAVVRSRKGLIGVEGGKGIFYQWKEKQASVRQVTVAVSATKPKIVRKNQNTLPPHLLSQPYHEVEVCRGRDVSEYLKGTCTRTSCEIGIHPSAISIKNEAVCKAGDKCVFPHCKVDEQPNKKHQKNIIPKRRERDDKNALAIVKSVSQMGCVSQDSDALVSQGRKSLGNPMQKVLSAIQRVRFTKSTLRHASIREKKGPSLGKLNVQVPHQRSPHAYEI